MVTNLFFELVLLDVVHPVAAFGHLSVPHIKGSTKKKKLIKNELFLRDTVIYYFVS